MQKPTQETFRHVLLAAIDACRYSNDDLAQRCGATYNTVVRWKNGKSSPAIHTRRALCKELLEDIHNSIPN